MATSVQERPPLESELGARRTAEQAARRRRLHWFDLATSLWSPITVLALALIPYLIIIESFPSTARAALPVMQGFGLLMVAWFVGLLVWRTVDRRGSELRPTPVHSSPHHQPEEPDHHQQAESLHDRERAPGRRGEGLDDDEVGNQREREHRNGNEQPPNHASPTA